MKAILPELSFRERPLPGNFDFEGLDAGFLASGFLASGFLAGAAGLYEKKWVRWKLAMIS